MKKTILLIFGILTAFAATCQYNYINYKNYDRSALAVNGDTWRFNNHYYIKLNGVAVQLDQAITASNGLTRTVDDIALGGAIVGTTFIFGGGVGNLSWGTSGSVLNNFTVEATTINLITHSSGSGINLLAPSGQISVQPNSDLNLTTTSGSVKIATAGSERIEIENDGAIQYSGSTGTSGQVLTSNGNASTPTWQTPFPTIGGSIASTQVGYGSGANTVSSEADFTYNSTTNTILLAGGLVANDVDASEVRIQTLPSSVGVMYNTGNFAAGLRNEDDFHYDPTLNKLSLITPGGVSAVYGGNNLAVETTNSFTFNSDGGGGWIFDTNSGGGDLTLDVDDTFITNTPDTGGGSVLVRSASTGEMLLSNITLYYNTDGTYSPTINNTTNVTSSTSATCQFIQLHTTVNVSGVITLVPSLDVGLVSFDLSIPVGATLSNISMLGGTATYYDGNETESIVVFANTVTNTARFILQHDVADAPVANIISFTFQYRGAAIP